MRALLLCLLTCTLVGFLVGCEECEECGPLQREPAVTLKFINQDSLEVVEDNITMVNQSIDAITQTMDMISEEKQFYDDSLAVVDQEIANGATDLDELRADLQNKSDSLETTFEDQQELRLVEQEKLVELQSTQTTITNGSIRIDSLVSSINNTSFDFGPDSLTLFSFPLSINMDSTIYDIYIDGEVYDLSLGYMRNFNEDEKSRIEVVASNVVIMGHSFNEAVISCEVCTSNETSITVFF